MACQFCRGPFIVPGWLSEFGDIEQDGQIQVGRSSVMVDLPARTAIAVTSPAHTSQCAFCFPAPLSLRHSSAHPRPPFRTPPPQPK